MWRRLIPLTLTPLTLAEWRHHPWRHGVALLAVALGVALAVSVQIINASALAEFSQALRAVNGEPDLVLAAGGADSRAGLDDAVLDLLTADERVAAASPVLELNTQLRLSAPEAAPAESAQRLNRGPTGQFKSAPADSEPRPSASDTAPIATPNATPIATPIATLLVGIDALQVARLAPALMPQPASGAALTAIVDPDSAWLNPAARARLGAQDGDFIELQSNSGWQRLRVAGSVAAGGGPLVVLDIAAAQQRFSRAGRLSRIDVRLVAGVDRQDWLRATQLPAEVRVAQADEALQRMSNLSRAYRVNLGVLALVALLVGGFLVYSVVSLSVAQRTPALALLGVLGVAARQRRAWVLAESAVLGAVGSIVGLALGIGLAALALRLLGGDLGGGYFPGVAPPLAWPLPALAGCAALGLLSAVAGAWWPARQAERLAPALALKGLGPVLGSAAPRWPALALLAGGAVLALLPPVAGLPLAAYVSVALLLAGGVALVPAMVQMLLSKGGSDLAAGLRRTWPFNAVQAPGHVTASRALPSQSLLLPFNAVRAPGHATACSVLVWLAWRRAHFARQSASAAVAGVVASLALSVALTVMVASFRQAVSDWLEQVLPADLYVRSGAGSAAGEGVGLPDGLVAAAAKHAGVVRVQPGRTLSMVIDPRQPAVALLARPLPEPQRQLPLVGDVLAQRAGELGVFISEPAAAIHQWAPGQQIQLPLPGGDHPARVRGVYRDYARQFGAVTIDLGDYQRLTGDLRLNDLALWLAPGTSGSDVGQAIQSLAGPDHPLQSTTTAELRSLSLAIFDRSFAVTRYLQFVAIAVGLVGVAASLSAQVLARRKEFGLLAHLGLTRRQVMALVTLESLAWLTAGCVIGVALGLAIAVVLVHVVNPQSFHWTMAMQLPVARLAALAALVLVAGGATAAFSARRASAGQAVQAVKADW